MIKLSLSQKIRSSNAYKRSILWFVGDGSNPEDLIYVCPKLAAWLVNTIV